MNRDKYIFIINLFSTINVVNMFYKTSQTKFDQHVSRNVILFETEVVYDTPYMMTSK